MTSLKGNHYIDLVLLSKKPIIVDAGAYCGEVSQQLRELIPASIIYAIEPSKSNLVELEKVQDIKIIPKALVGIKRKIKFGEVPDRPQWGKISEDGYEVETITLDEFEHIDYLKMDIEGTEEEVIDNLTNLPTQISMEVHQNKEKIIKKLKELGYEIIEFVHKEIYAKYGNNSR